MLLLYRVLKTLDPKRIVITVNGAPGVPDEENIIDYRYINLSMRNALLYKLKT